MKLIDRIKAPTPKFFKNIIRIILIISAGALALLLAPAATKTIMPGYTFTLFPITELICKNLFVAGLVAAAVSKAARENNEDVINPTKNNLN